MEPQIRGYILKATMYLTGPLWAQPCFHGFTLLLFVFGCWCLVLCCGWCFVVGGFCVVWCSAGQCGWPFGRPCPSCLLFWCARCPVVPVARAPVPALALPCLASCTSHSSLRPYLAPPPYYYYINVLHTQSQPHSTRIDAPIPITRPKHIANSPK